MEYQRIKMVNKYQILTNINHGVEKNFLGKLSTFWMMEANMKFLETLIKKMLKYIMIIQKI